VKPKGPVTGSLFEIPGSAYHDRKSEPFRAGHAAVLFGVDSRGKAKAARFGKEHAGLAMKAANQLQLQVLASNDPKITDIFAHQLRAAQQRISELEAEVAAYQNQAERAEQWLHKVYTEIEDRFLRQERSGALRQSR
jgi:hypothetical protein